MEVHVDLRVVDLFQSTRVLLCDQEQVALPRDVEGAQVGVQFLRVVNALSHLLGLQRGVLGVVDEPSTFVVGYGAVVDLKEGSMG